MPDLLTTREVLELLRISRPTLYSWIASGRLESIRPTGPGKGRKTLIPRSSVEALLAAGSSGSK